MKVPAIMLNAFGLFLRDRLLIIFFALFLCVILLFATPLLIMKATITASNEVNVKAFVLQMVSTIMALVSGAGSLLAAWIGADAIFREMSSGTILAVMARPLKRWEFVLGKYLGVLLFMSCYVVTMFLLTLLLAKLGGQEIPVKTWPLLLIYPLVRYAIYAAIAMAVATLLHPVLSWAFVLILGVVAAMVEPGGRQLPTGAAAVRTVLYYLLPSTSFLSEDRFLTIKHAALRQAGWLDHLTTLAYGIDYALVVLIIAMWSFHYRSLKRD